MTLTIIAILMMLAVLAACLLVYRKVSLTHDLLLSAIQTDVAEQETAPVENNHKEGLQETQVNTKTEPSTIESINRVQKAQTLEGEPKIVSQPKVKLQDRILSELKANGPLSVIELKDHLGKPNGVELMLKKYLAGKVVLEGGKYKLIEGV